MSQSGFDGYEPQGASKQQPYVYSALQASSEEIRLLTLFPGVFGTAIYCQLKKTKLRKNSPPRYEALSYAWGLEEDPIIIYIGEGALPVTQNLASALQHLRYPDRPRTLWIDAICVNQKDLNERSQQVARMADIYTLADCVVVWLGPEAGDSPRILRTFDTIGSMIEADWSTYSTKPSEKAISTGELHWADRSVEMPFKERELDPAYHLFARPWFKRLWVQQEIVLATKAVLVCGFENIQWYRFRTAILYLYVRLPDNQHVVDDFRRLWECLLPVTELCSMQQRLSLRQQIRRTQHCKCSDPRDRIYALLSISGNLNGVHITVDYRRSANEIFKDVVLQQYKWHLFPLIDCEMQIDRSERPSWVPDWTTPHLANEMPSYQASGNTDSLVKHTDGDVLGVIGMRVTKVRTAEYMAFPNKWASEFIAAIRKHAPSGLNLDGSQVLDMYCRTLLFNQFSEFFEPSIAGFPNLEESREVLRSFLDEDQPSPPREHERRFFSSAAAAMNHRSLFCTEDGRVGLGPAQTTRGDEIVVLPGCPSPMILRPSPVGNGRHRVVGKCFIHDLMNGEAILGPLPEDYECINKLDRTVGFYHNSYRNTLSGDIQDEDPRFGLMYSEMREDGRKRFYPTGPPNVEGEEYIGLRGRTSWRRERGEVEIMRNDLEPFLLE